MKSIDINLNDNELGDLLVITFEAMNSTKAQIDKLQYYNDTNKQILLNNYKEYKDLHNKINRTINKLHGYIECLNSVK